MHDDLLQSDQLTHDLSNSFPVGWVIIESFTNCSGDGHRDVVLIKYVFESCNDNARVQCTCMLQDALLCVQQVGTSLLDTG